MWILMEIQSWDRSAEPNYRKSCGLIWAIEYGVNSVTSFSSTSYIFTIILLSHLGKSFSITLSASVRFSIMLSFYLHLQGRVMSITKQIGTSETNNSLRMIFMFPLRTDYHNICRMILRINIRNISTCSINNGVTYCPPWR